ncbi:MAG: M48 family metallopeptidase [Pirellulales bacterium]
MDFFEHQARARRKTFQLVVYFLAAVVCIIVAVYVAIAGVFVYYGGWSEPGAAKSLWLPDVFLVVSAATLVVISAGTGYKTLALSGGGETVARTLGGRQVNPNTRDLPERVLLNVVEEMAIASGTPVPPVYVMDNERSINAFAAGTTPQNAVIGVTRGTIETLKRDELQGVIAHEFSHILNGDMRLNIRLIAILNGILLIATIGYILMRTGGSSRSYFSSSKKGGNPLPLVGLLLYIIGYVGVFFGHLIKSAVSRQREFLADASAVQFTRYPEGIAGALKKIGGLAEGSRIRSEHAEEASHMYFGNGLRQPLFELLATHPPLAERVRRIDPRFDGKFPRTAPVVHSADELVDPQRLAARLGAGENVHAAAVAGASAFARHPIAAVEKVGRIDTEHVAYASALVGDLPLEVASTVRDPLGAVAVVYALLLNADDAEIRRAQLAYLADTADQRANAETLRIVAFVGQVRPESRLPLVAMTLPALKSLSQRQRKAFGDDVLYLMKADNRVSLFEYAVHRLIVTRLVDRLAHRPPRSAQPQTVARLVPAMTQLVSTLAQWGSTDDALARRAFEEGVRMLPGTPGRIALLSRDKCDLRTLDTALDQLAVVGPEIKKPILQACAACIAADGKATVEEAEIMRVIADALDCPMPPLVELRGVA